MAKKDKKAKVTKAIPEGMKCYEKIGGGSLRFPKRMIKPTQRFWAFPETVDSFKLRLKEVAADYGAVIIYPTSETRIEGVKEAEIIPEKFKMEKALDEQGEVIKKGDSALYNVVGEDGKPANEKPLRKGKAEELLESLNS